jgi:iron complex transport system substrate-binding protein
MRDSSAVKSASLILVLLAMLLAVAAGCLQTNGGKPAQNSPGPTATVTDSVGRVVEVPEGVKRIACLYAFSGHVVAMLGAGDDIVAVVQGLKRDILLNEVVPTIGGALVPFASDKVNIEELVRSQPDLVFIQLSTYQDQGEREKLDKLKVPYFVVDFDSIASQMNTIEMMGKAIGKGDKAKKYTAYYQNALARVANVVDKIPAAQRVKIFHSVNEATRTDAPDTLPADWTRVAGVINVSVGEQLRFADNKHYANLEQIYLWDPDAILVNEDAAYEYITTNANWASLRAVKNHKVHKMPNGISRWGHQGSLETPLAVLWAARTFYPDRFQNLDMRQETRSFYQTFFNYPLDDDGAERVLAGLGMRQPKGN